MVDFLGTSRDGFGDVYQLINQCRMQVRPPEEENAGYSLRVTESLAPNSFELRAWYVYIGYVESLDCTVVTVDIHPQYNMSAEDAAKYPVNELDIAAVGEACKQWFLRRNPDSKCVVSTLFQLINVNS